MRRVHFNCFVGDPWFGRFAFSVLVVGQPPLYIKVTAARCCLFVVVVANDTSIEGHSTMPWSAVAIGRLALAVLAMGAALAACAQQSQEAESASVPGSVPASVPGSVIVHPARVAVAGSPPAYERAANLRPPPEGPIESRL